MFKRIVRLSVGHGAGLKPAVKNLRHAAHQSRPGAGRSRALIAGNLHLINKRPVQVKLFAGFRINIDSDGFCKTRKPLLLKIRGGFCEGQIAQRAQKIHERAFMRHKKHALAFVLRENIGERFRHPPLHILKALPDNPALRAVALLRRKRRIGLA